MYETQSPDTSVEAERLLIEHYRSVSPWERLRKAGELGAFAEAVAMAGIRRRHPSASEQYVRIRLAALTIERETMIRLLGWDPEFRGY